MFWKQSWNDWNRARPITFGLCGKFRRVSYGAFKESNRRELYAPFAGKPKDRVVPFRLVRTLSPANENWVFHQDFSGFTTDRLIKMVRFWSGDRMVMDLRGVWPYLWMNNQSNWTYYFGKKVDSPLFGLSNQSLSLPSFPGGSNDPDLSKADWGTPLPDQPGN